LARAALIDVDGTLVDSTYLHAVAWKGALRVVGFDVPTSRPHRLIGMRGDRLLTELLGDRDAQRVADEAEAEQGRRFGAVRDQVAPLPYARDLLELLAELGMPAVLASSADEEEIEYYVDLLDARDLVVAWTSASDGGRSKPDPEPLRLALERSGCDTGIMIGDSPWDCRAATAAGLSTLAVLTGGFARSELEAAGAAGVYEHLGEVCEELRRM
jgi:HAD superfamily hydrolase (TIGR01549 family)